MEPCAMRSRSDNATTSTKHRIAAGEALGRLMEGLFLLVERAGWRSATLLCTFGIMFVSLASAVTIALVTNGPAGVAVGHLVAHASVTLLVAAPCLAIALKLVEHLGRTRERLLVEIDRRLLAEQQLRRLATTDDLTGLSNRRHFVERAREAIAVARRYGQWCSFAVIDIDRFKKVNDQRGHQAGDEALVSLAAVLKANLRTTDLAARFGGDEFVVLMPLTDPEAGRAAAERIRHAATRDVSGMAFTVSVGVASLKGDEAVLEELMARADQALYDAKRSGRDRVRAFA